MNWLCLHHSTTLARLPEPHPQLTPRNAEVARGLRSRWELARL